MSANDMDSFFSLLLGLQEKYEQEDKINRRNPSDRRNRSRRPNGDGDLNKTFYGSNFKDEVKVNHDQTLNSSTDSHAKASPRCTSCDTFLDHLSIGDAGSSQDMMPVSTPSMIQPLKKHDFAFIRRSDGRWTYAIIADRQDDHILFVVDPDGSTKNISRRKLLSGVRIVNAKQQERFTPEFQDSSPSAPSTPSSTMSD
eukprot:875724_1